MNRPVRVTDEADADVTSAARWYAARSERAAHSFLKEVVSSFQHIGQFPHGAPKVRGLVRQLPVAGFPFVILYRPMKDHIVVLRVFHTSRHPEEKFKRR